MLDGFHVRRFIPVFFIATLLLSSCGQTPSLWGTYATPTSELVFPTMVLPEPQPATASPTHTPVPTGTFTATPTLIPLQSSTAQPTFNGTPGMEGTLTPTFDVPATLYYSQSGDDLESLAARFSVDPSEIRADITFTAKGVDRAGYAAGHTRSHHRKYDPQYTGYPR